MYMLANMNMGDLSKICFIIFIFVVIITILIVISSIDFKKNKKKKENKGINFDDLKEQVNQIKENKEYGVIEQIRENNKVTSEPEEVVKETVEEENINEIINNSEIKENRKASLDDILSKLEEDIISEKTTAHSFEELQEEKAIISYKELLKVAGKLKEENENYDDEIENTRSYKFPELKEINKIADEIKENKAKETFREEIYDEPITEIIKSEPKVEKIRKEQEVVKKFKSSDIISPVYGKVKVEETEEESEFLKKLKDLRNNLK